MMSLTENEDGNVNLLSEQKSVDRLHDRSVNPKVEHNVYTFRNTAIEWIS